MRFYCLVGSPTALERGIITKTLHEEGTDGTSPSHYTATVYVFPNTAYIIELEVLKNYFGADDKKVSNIKVNGKLIGECNPSGVDNDCKFYNCTSELTMGAILSETGRVLVELAYPEISQQCVCNKDTWECKKDTWDGASPMVAVARFTLTPIGIVNQISR